MTFRKNTAKEFLVAISKIFVSSNSRPVPRLGFNLLQNSYLAKLNEFKNRPRKKNPLNSNFSLEIIPAENLKIGKKKTKQEKDLVGIFFMKRSFKKGAKKREKLRQVFFQVRESSNKCNSSQTLLLNFFSKESLLPLFCCRCCRQQTEKEARKPCRYNCHSSKVPTLHTEEGSLSLSLFVSGSLSRAHFLALSLFKH